MASDSKKRPTSEQRRQVILAAAAKVFFEQGYSGASVDSIIELIGGSKRTVYSEFGSKEGLLNALVAEAAEGALAKLTHPETLNQTVREVLLGFARRVMDIYVSPSMIGIYRIIVTEAQRFPELAASFYENGPGRAEQELGAALANAVVKGEIYTSDTRLAASHFVGMLRDNFHLKVVLGLTPMPSAEMIEHHVVSAVDIFLSGIKTR